MKGKWWLVVLAAGLMVVLQACESSVPDNRGNQGNQIGAHTDEYSDSLGLSGIKYILNSADAQAKSSKGYFEFTSEKPFDGFELIITAKGLSSPSYQVKNQNGEWGLWKSLPVEWSFDAYHNSFVELTDAATALRIKDLGEVQFVQTNFLHKENANQTSSFTTLAAKPGWWRLPKNVAALAKKEYVHYDYQGTKCLKGLTGGAKQLIKYFEVRFGDAISGIGGNPGNCRPNTANPKQLSMHDVGRALDLMIPEAGNLKGDPADNDVGDPIANWLVVHAQQIGIQYIIWDHSQWEPYKIPPVLATYPTSKNPPPTINYHFGHIHVEITKEAANEKTPWFTGNLGNIKYSDLKVENLELSPNHALPGATIKVSFDLMNQGKATATMSKSISRIRIKKSPDSVNTSDRLLTTIRNIPDIAPKESRHIAESVTIPSNLAAGSYYIWADADVNSKAGQGDKTTNLGC